MTHSQLLPPVRPNEAVALAELILSLTKGRSWSNDLRPKLASSLPTIKLESLTPFPYTFTTDPTHSSTFFLIVSNAAGNWILHIAPASAATTPLFPNPILLARVRPAGEREIVINAIPLEGNIEAVIKGLHPDLLARATSLQDLWSFPLSANLKYFPKRRTLLPAIRTNSPGWSVYQSILLSNWRDGFIAILEKQTTPPSALEAEPFSRFSYLVQDPQNPRPIADFYYKLKANHKRGFDFEIDLTLHPTLDLITLETLLDNLKLLAIPIQSVELSNLDFAPLLQARQIGITLQAQEPGEPVNGQRTHWKLAAEAPPLHN